MELMEAQQSQVLNLERVQELETWLKTTNTKLTQVNGQRKYGGPPEVWVGPAPGARCEVFISQISRDVYEDQLIPLFSSVGPLWEFRLMMNFSGQNRGFAYAKYGSPVIATDAIRLLHGHMLEPGLCLSVRRSTEKRHLCLGGLPTSTQPEELLQALRGLTEGVERLSLKTGPGIEGVSAIIAFSSHHTASMAKKVLVEAFKRRFSLAVSVKWQSTVRQSVNEPLPPHKPSLSLLPSTLTPPRHALRSQQCCVPPPRLARPPPIPPGFCRAVGGPAALLYPSCPSSALTTLPPSQGQRVPPVSPVMLLERLCEGTGVGQPLYELHYSHMGPDGFLYFTYKVCIPGISTVFEGLVMTLAGPSVASAEEARRAVAQQVLQKVSQLSH